MKSTADVIFRAPDLMRVKAFYQRFGWPLVKDTPTMVGFKTGGLTFYFEQGEPNGPVFEFDVDDPAAAGMELADAGCEIVEDNPAVPRLYVRDPFGVVFNLNRAG